MESGRLRYIMFCNTCGNPMPMVSTSKVNCFKCKYEGRVKFGKRP